MKEIILVIIGAIVLVTGLEPYINSNSQYLAEKAKSEQAIQALGSQKAARKADLEYMDQVVEIANACAAIPFDFCPDKWTDQAVVNSYTQQGIVGLPGWRYYSILSFAFVLKILSVFFSIFAVVKAWEWFNAPPKRKVIEAQATIDKGEQWEKSIKAEMAPERNAVLRDIECFKDAKIKMLEENTALISENISLKLEGDQLRIENQDLRDERVREAEASRKLNVLFDKKEDSPKSVNRDDDADFIGHF